MKNEKMNSKPLKRATQATLLLTLSACGGAQNSSELCSFDVFQNSTETQSTRTLVELQGPLPEACQTLTRENTGKLVVDVRVEGDPNPGVALAEVKSGNRTREFDESVTNLGAGSVDARFSSLIEPDWQVPWEDRPSSFTVALSAPLGSTASNLPNRARVTLSL